VSRPTDHAAGIIGDALGDGGTIRRDTIGPAVYRIDPGAEATAIACERCRFVQIVLTIPRVAALVAACPQCGRRVALAPPLDVLAAGQRPAGRPS
jgi:ribosomal protein S27E